MFFFIIKEKYKSYQSHNNKIKMSTENQQVFDNTQETIKEIKEGNLPSNKEIKGGISEIQESISENKDSLSNQGQKVAKDAEKLLETTKKLVEQKNDGELIQEIYNQTYKATNKQTFDERRQKLKEIILNTKNNEEKQDEVVEAANQITKILRLLVTSTEFRRFINDLETIFEKTFVNSNNSSDISTFERANKSNCRSYYYGSNHCTIDPNYFTYCANSNGNSAEAKIGNEITIGDTNQSISKDEAADEIEQTLIDHWARMAHVLNENPEYRQSISYLMRTFNSLSNYVSEKAEKLEKVHEKEEKKSQNQNADKHAEIAWKDAKKFIENWIGNDYSLDEFLNSLENLSNKAKNDEELQEYMNNLLEFFEKSLADNEYVQNEEKVKNDARNRIIKGRQLFQGKYQKEFEKIFEELQFLNDSIQNDEGINQLQHDFKQLTKDLFFDEKGNATIHTELLRDLQLIVPSLVKNLRKLPIPDIEFCDDNSDLKIKNALLDCGDISPSYFRFTVTGSTDDDDMFNNRVTVFVSKIRAKICNADFYYNKKTFPSFSESGNADLMIYGNTGLSFAFEICHDGEEFSIERNACHIDKVNLRMKNTSHDILYGFLSPVINAYIKPRLEKLVQQSLKEVIEDSTKDAKQYIEKTMQDAMETTQQNAKIAQKKLEENLNVD